MKLDIKKQSDFEVTLEAVFKWKEIESDFIKELNKMKSSYQISGFRKGRVPEHIFRKNIGASIDAQFIDNRINHYYREALQKSKLTPINTGQIKKVDFSEGKDLTFSVQFEIMPEFKLPNYQKKVTIKTNKYIANDKDTKQSIEDIRTRYAKAKSVERPLKSGDFIYADFNKLDEKGNPQEEGELKNHYIKIGEGLFVDNLEKPFLNKKVGDKINIDINQSNNKVRYKVTINKIEETMLPEINDDLAKLVDPKLTNLKQLQEKIKESIQSNLNNENKKEFHNKIIEYFVEKSKFLPPTSIVDNYKKALEKDYKNKYKDTYDEQKMKPEIEKLAINTVKWHLIKDLLINEGKITISKDDVENKIETFIKDNDSQKSEIKNFYKKDENKQKLAEDLINQYLFDFLDKFFVNKIKESSTDIIRNKKGK